MNPKGRRREDRIAGFMGLLATCPCIPWSSTALWVAAKEERSRAFVRHARWQVLRFLLGMLLAVVGALILAPLLTNWIYKAAFFVLMVGVIGMALTGFEYPDDC